MDRLTSALEWYRRGDFARAEAACVDVLSRSANHAAALALLADIHLAGGHPAAAIPVLSRLVQLDPNDPSLRRRLGGALLSTGQPAAAASTLRAAIALDPGNPRAHNNLGQSLRQMGDISAAITSYQTALECDPGYAIAHSNLGLAFTQIGDPVRAEASLRRAIELQPDLAAPYLNMGALFERRQRLPEALASYEQAIAVSPQLPEAWLRRGSVLSQLAKLASALQSYETALQLNPGDAASLAGKASVLLAMHRAADALATADNALTIDSESVDALNARAGALRRLNRHAEALACFEQALRLKPAFVEGWCNRGLICYEIGDSDAAAASYQRALALDPLCVLARVRLLAARIPPIPASPQESAGARLAFDEELAQLESWFDSATATPVDAFIAARQTLFYLSYREESNAGRLRRYRHASSAWLARALDASVPSAGVSAPAITDPARRKFKLGFVSAHVFDHSVWAALLQGWLKCLDRARFDITVFSVGSRQDDVTRAARTLADRFESDARSLPDWVHSIRDSRLDAVIYPEVGMDEITLGLANLRLAPRQLVSWGHPETSGLPTMDGYLSAEAFEPEDAQRHYTERLVPLPRLGAHIERLGIHPAWVDFDALGISRDGALFVCPGVPFKYQPQDDQVLVEIARRLGRCTFVLFMHERIALSTKLHARLSAAFRRSDLDPQRHLAVIPWLARASFLGLLQQADVYLDTIGFSGFNTMMQAVESGLPCVTHEGRFMRGRFGSGIVRQLGLPELIAANHAQYIEIAVRLAEDPRYRAEVRERMRRAEHLLYADMAPVEALSDLLLK